MKADVEKVITMSLTKMAESRGLRRGGTSLHKHLLISSVLTKARTAYMDAWCTVDTSSNTAEISIHSRPTGAPKLISNEDPLTEEEEATLLDSRSLFQLDGTEMDLPRDILNCVEKLGGIPDDVEFSLREAVIPGEEDEESEEERRTTAELILADFVDGLDAVDSPSKSFTYLDLDESSKEAMGANDIDSLSAQAVTGSSSESLLGEAEPDFSPTPKSKRRRDWNFDLEEDEEDEENSGSSILGQTKRFRFALSGNYTFRATCESKENTIPAGTSMLMSITNYNNPSVNRTPLEPFFTFKGNNFNFRTKKSQFEECEDEAEDSPFLFEDDDIDGYGGPGEKRKNDRRVPSSNGSCSSSDEEQCGEDPAMDVDLDKITSLVQYISFNKGSSSSGGGGSGTPGLVRSISTPDLFSSCPTTKSSSSSSDLTGDNSSSILQPNSKDLYTSCFNSHSYHQRVLTMKV